MLTEGIVLSGGLAQLNGLAQLLSESTGVVCRLAENPEDCVALGTVKAIQYVNRMASGVYDIGQFTNTPDRRLRAVKEESGRCRQNRKSL